MSSHHLHKPIHRCKTVNTGLGALMCCRKRQNIKQTELIKNRQGEIKNHVHIILIETYSPLKFHD